jgi:hypothetical protein
VIFFVFVDSAGLGFRAPAHSPDLWLQRPRFLPSARHMLLFHFVIFGRSRLPRRPSSASPARQGVSSPQQEAERADDFRASTSIRRYLPRPFSLRAIFRCPHQFPFCCPGFATAGRFPLGFLVHALHFVARSCSIRPGCSVSSAWLRESICSGAADLRFRPGFRFCRRPSPVCFCRRPSVPLIFFLLVVPAACDSDSTARPWQLPGLAPKVNVALSDFSVNPSADLIFCTHRFFFVSIGLELLV